MPNGTTKSKIKTFLLKGKVLTSCGCSSKFITADLRKYISMLRAEGLNISDELVENGNNKRFKKYFIKIEQTELF